MGSQVSTRQKKDLAKYYTSLLGSKEQGSVNAYMHVEGANGGGHQGEKKRKRKHKKKRAVSHAISEKPMRGNESQKNLLTMENDAAFDEQHDERSA